ncbi:hypothetical protein D3C77_423390 [compost metagenome]
MLQFFLHGLVRLTGKFRRLNRLANRLLLFLQLLQFRFRCSFTLIQFLDLQDIMPFLLAVELKLLGYMPPLVLHLLQLACLRLFFRTSTISSFAQFLQLLLALVHLGTNIIKSISQLLKHFLAFTNIRSKLIQLALTA